MAYIERLVSVQELYGSEKTAEPSLRALRTRAEEEILVFVKSSGNEYLYDEMLSIIRVRAARQCKRPRIRWRDISKELKHVSLTNDRIKELLGNETPEEKVIEMLKNELYSRLATL